MSAVGQIGTDGIIAGHLAIMRIVAASGSTDFLTRAQHRNRQRRGGHADAEANAPSARCHADTESATPALRTTGSVPGELNRHITVDAALNIRFLSSHSRWPFVDDLEALATSKYPQRKAFL